MLAFLHKCGVNETMTAIYDRTNCNNQRLPKNWESTAALMHELKCKEEVINSKQSCLLDTRLKGSESVEHGVQVITAEVTAQLFDLSTVDRSGGYKSICHKSLTLKTCVDGELENVVKMRKAVACPGVNDRDSNGPLRGFVRGQVKSMISPYGVFRDHAEPLYSPILEDI